jgi:arginase
MRLALLQVPYDAGHYGRRMGRGPLHLIDTGLVRELTAAGHDVQLVPIRLPEGFSIEAGAAVEAQRRVAEAARAARGESRLPILLAGNCNASLGVLAALGPGATGLVWLDAHADFNTPETTLSGFFDGMALSMITGSAWQAMAATVAGFHPLDERNVLLVGARDLDAAEEQRLAASHLQRIAAEDIPELAAGAVAQLARRVSRLHFHIDLDVLDPSVGRANAYAAPGGLSLVQTETLIAAAGARCEIAAAAFTAYDPQEDTDGRIGGAVRSLLTALLETLQL